MLKDNMDTGLTPFNFEGAPVRVVQIEGEPHFIGKDVAERLGYADPTNAMKQHCRGVVKRHPIVDALGRSQQARIISEPDVLRLIIKSTLPAADRFERWVFEDVLPSIRKTGAYASPGVSYGGLAPETLEMVRRTDGISRMLSHKVTEIEKTLPTIVAALSLIAAQLTPNAGLIARRGRTAGEIWKEGGFPKLKVTSWFSNRLVQMGCQIEGGVCGELGGRTAKLFDPDRSRTWLDNGGRALVAEYLARRQGQKVFRLVPKTEPQSLTPTH